MRNLTIALTWQAEWPPCHLRPCWDYTDHAFRCLTGERYDTCCEGREINLRWLWWHLEVTWLPRDIEAAEAKRNREREEWRRKQAGRLP